jgi:hypothetical protein
MISRSTTFCCSVLTGSLGWEEHSTNSSGQLDIEELNPRIPTVVNRWNRASSEIVLLLWLFKKESNVLLLQDIFLLFNEVPSRSFIPKMEVPI